MAIASKNGYRRRSPLTSLDKAAILTFEQFDRPIYQIRRIPPGAPRTIRTQGPPNAASHAVIPLRIITGDPRVAARIGQSQKSLSIKLGRVTFINEDVEITPAMDVLLVTSYPGSEVGQPEGPLA